MRKFLIVNLISFSTILFGQKVEKLFNDRKFTELIALESESKDFSGEELYYLGYAFFSKENDNKAIEYYDKALGKGFDNAIVFFQKGFSEMYLKKYDDALKNYDSAISKAPLAEFYVEKARVFHFKEDYKSEEETYAEGLEKSQLKDDKWYLELIKNAGIFYYAQVKDFPKSEKVYIDGINRFSDDYVLYEKLIKALNAQNKFSDANKIFEKMRTFYSENKLPEDNMKFKNLAVDEFEWNGQWINVFKSFEKAKDMLDSIYIVYLIDKAGEKIERKFNIEKTLQINGKGPEFVICEESKNSHTTFPIGFKDEHFTLEDLRQEIKKILDHKVKVAGSVKIK